MVRKTILIFTVLVMVFGFTNSLYAKPETPKSVLFTPSYNIQNNPYFDWVLREKVDPKDFEEAKIEYLIERIRKSPYKFVRNGNEHSSNEAAEHLTWKYRKVKERIGTAEEFINNLATRSFTSGKLYMTKLEDGNYYPTGDILENELLVLEQNLKNILTSASLPN